MTVRRTSVLLRSRTPRTYSSLRSSSAAMLWALIMPRSATTQMRPTLKRSAQPVDDRQQGGDIGGVAGPQLAAQRPAVLIHDQPDDDLMEIRAVVFRMAATTKLLAAPSLEGQAGGGP